MAAHNMLKTENICDAFKRNNERMQMVRCDEFERLKGEVYLDHAGATLYARQQVKHFSDDLLSNVYGNPHSGSSSSRLTADLIQQTRYRVLQHVNTDSEEYSVIFTSGCTAALKLIAESFSLYSNHSNTNNDTNRHINENDKGSSSHGTTSCSSLSQSSGYHHTDSASVLPSASASEADKASKFAPVFCHLDDNHTSVIGMREIFSHRGAKVVCVTQDQLGHLCQISGTDTGDDRTMVVTNNKSAEKESIKQSCILRTCKQVSKCDKLQQLNSGIKLSPVAQQCVCFYDNKDQKLTQVHPSSTPNHLFVYPAQSNFSGYKYPLSWLQGIKAGGLCCHGDWYTVLDAASYMASAPLDLRLHKPDFVTLSFYKIFGFPTGIGALLVRNTSAHLLQKIYFGGGTVAVSLATESFHVNKTDLSERFEDGTVAYLDILALHHGFHALETLGGGMTTINHHTFHLAQFVYHNLSSLKHGNSEPVAIVYSHTDYSDPNTQGAIVNFNLLRANGDHVGFSEVDKLAQAHSIHLRTGCFCNMGACQQWLQLSPLNVIHNFKKGHVCGDDLDLIDGQPTGSVRLSFGYMSTLDDAEKFLQFVCDCFIERPKQNTQVFSFPIDKCQHPIKPQVKIARNDKSTDRFVSNEVNITNVKEDNQIDTENQLSPGNKFTTQDLQSNKHKLENLMKNFPNSKSSESSRRDQSGINGDNKISDAKDEISQESFHKSSLTNDSLKLSARLPSCQGNRISLAQMFIYPVKSCAAFEVFDWKVGERGLLFDREWMVVTDTGVCLTQKRAPQLCQIKPMIDLDAKTLTLQFKDLEGVIVPLDDRGSHNAVETSMCQSKVCGDRVSGLDCGKEVSHWLSQVLGRPGCRLVRQCPERNRLSKRQAQDGTESNLSLVNESQYLLISQSSIQRLDQWTQWRHLMAAEGRDGTGSSTEQLLRRFRANLVISGNEAFSEDHWQTLTIGEYRFQSQGLCTRCQMICIDQTTGERNKEPLVALSSHRGRKNTFGIYLSHAVSSCQDDRLIVGQIVKPNIDNNT